MTYSFFPGKTYEEFERFLFSVKEGIIFGQNMRSTSFSCLILATTLGLWCSVTFVNGQQKPGNQPPQVLASEEVSNNGLSEESTNRRGRGLFGTSSSTRLLNLLRGWFEQTGPADNSTAVTVSVGSYLPNISRKPIIPFVCNFLSCCIFNRPTALACCFFTSVRNRDQDSCCNCAIFAGTNEKVEIPENILQ